MADALRAEGARVTFVGGERAETELVPAAGYELRRIAVEGLSRTHPLRALRALARAALALPRARAILRELEPDAVLGAGGYVAGPVGLAALSLRIPLVLSEADSHLGLTNRLLARGARRVCLAFPIPGRGGERSPAQASPNGRYRVTGRPIPVPDAEREAARARYGIGAGERCVLIFGGSLGASSLNRAALEAFGEGVRPGLRVLHVAGRRDYPELAPRRLPAGYDLREYLDLPAFAQALAAADLVVARAGGSVFELAAYGCPAILVPYPQAAGDHQSANARWMVAGGAAVAIADAQLDGARLAREVAGLLEDRARLARMAVAARGLARPGAAREVAGELLAAARAGRTGAGRRGART